MPYGYDLYQTDVVGRGRDFPQHLLPQVMQQGYSPSTHEELQRCSAEDFVSGRSWWYAMKKTDDDEFEDIAYVPEGDSAAGDAVDYPDVDASAGADETLPESASITYADTPIPGVPEQAIIFDDLQLTRNAFGNANTTVELPEDITDDVPILAMKKASAVQMLYTALCSMPVNLDASNIGQEEDVRTVQVTRLVSELGQLSGKQAHEKLSAMAMLFFKALVQLHSGGYMVKMPTTFRRSDKRLTAVQRLEALLQYLPESKCLTLKCLKDGEDAIAEVVAFPRTMFEWCLKGYLTGDSEEQAQEAEGATRENGVGEEQAGEGQDAAGDNAETAVGDAGTLPAQAPATTAAPVTDAPKLRSYRRRVKPRLPSNF